MEIPMGDDNFFHPADLNICIFPHLNEFLVVDARATVPGGPHAYLLATNDVLDSEFYGDVEGTITEIIRDTPRTFVELGQLSQRMDDAIREQALRAILRRVGTGVAIDDDDGPEVSVFLCVGPALSIATTEMNEAVRAMLGGQAEAGVIKECQLQMSRLVGEERAEVRSEESDLARRAVAGDQEYYFTVWARSAEHDAAD